jgi:hypothetical protein
MHGEYDLNVGRWMADHPDYCQRAGVEGQGSGTSRLTSPSGRPQVTVTCRQRLI